MPVHAEFLESFDAGLCGIGVPTGVTAADPAEAARRFSVYRNNVTVSLTAALARRFPVIQRLVGPDFFQQMARLFAETHRPRTPVLLEWGGSFPDFLAGFPPLAEYPYMADVALIEVARGQAYHAADRAPIASGVLCNVDPARLVLSLHPSVRVMRLDYAAVSVWTQNQPGAVRGPLDITVPQIALILRDAEYKVPVLSISGADAVMIDRIGAGATLTAAATTAQRQDPTHDPAALVRHLMQAGAFTDPKEIAR